VWRTSPNSGTRLVRMSPVLYTTSQTPHGARSTADSRMAVRTPAALNWSPQIPRRDTGVRNSQNCVGARMSCHNTPPDSSRLVGQALIAPTQPGPHPLSILPTPPRGQLPTIPALVVMLKGDHPFDLYHAHGIQTRI